MLAEPTCRLPEGFVRTEPLLLGWVLANPGRFFHSDHHAGPCLLEGEPVDLARRHPCGGLVPCEVCGRPVFVAPDTCLERVEDDLEEIDGGIHRPA